MRYHCNKEPVKLQKLVALSIKLLELYTLIPWPILDSER